jgi:integral membrane protein
LGLNFKTQKPILAPFVLFFKYRLFMSAGSVGNDPVTIFALEKSHNNRHIVLMISSLFKTSLGRLRIIAFVEGISYLLLLGIAMPLKYIVGIPQPVRVIGMAHGVLFVLFIILLLQVTIEKNWSIKKSILSFLSSLVPFGTFYADAKLFRD